MESNAESAETCHRKVATSTLKVATSSQKMATSMLKVASDIYKTPLYRTAHSPENFSDEWAFFFPCIKFTFVVTQIATKSWMLSGRFSFTGTGKSCLEHLDKVARLLWIAGASSSNVIFRLCRNCRILFPISILILDIAALRNHRFLCTETGSLF